MGVGTTWQLGLQLPTVTFRRGDVYGAGTRKWRGSSLVGQRYLFVVLSFIHDPSDTFCIGITFIPFIRLTDSLL
jgi:hypothetical protein